MTGDHLKVDELARQEQAFAEFTVLAKKAQETMKLSDAIAAGKAWGRFLHLFCDWAPQ